MSSIIDKFLSSEITYEELLKEATTLRETGNYNTFGLNSAEFELYQRLGTQALDDIIAARQHKTEIIEKWKNFFRQEIAASHRKNTLKLARLKEFQRNPFLDTYKANFLSGNNSAESQARALVYARALSTSINTTFGVQLQKFCSDILSGYASTTSGIDIEFIDFIDGRRKYCQIKAGPNTINKDDVKTISDHFSGVKNLARTNHLDISFNDLVVGVFYGTERDLSSHYKRIKKEYPVYVGQEFWYRLTGDANFYNELIAAVNEVATEYDGRELLEQVITSLADEISKQNEAEKV